MRVWNEIMLTFCVVIKRDFTSVGWKPLIFCVDLCNAADRFYGGSQSVFQRKYLTNEDHVGID